MELSHQMLLIADFLRKLFFEHYLIFICSLAITACELNDKVERVSTSGLDTLNWDSVDIAIDDSAEQDYYDSVQHKWIGPRADRLNGVDLSPVE